MDYSDRDSGGPTPRQRILETAAVVALLIVLAVTAMSLAPGPWVDPTASTGIAEGASVTDVEWAPSVCVRNGQRWDLRWQVSLDDGTTLARTRTVPALADPAPSTDGDQAPDGPSPTAVTSGQGTITSDPVSGAPYPATLTFTFDEDNCTLG